MITILDTKQMLTSKSKYDTIHAIQWKHLQIRTAIGQNLKRCGKLIETELLKTCNKLPKLFQLPLITMQIYVVMLYVATML